MKNLYVFLILLPLFLLEGSITAHENHNHEPISKNEVINKAKLVIGKMLKKGKLKESWKSIEDFNAEKKSSKNGEEWVVTAKNLNGTSEKKELFLFFSLSGEYKAANFTGN